MKRTLMCLCALAVIGIAFAIEVDQNELKQAENTPIEFINYTGSHTEIDSLRAIAEIGKGLAGAARRGRAGDMNRYAVIHAVDTTVTTGLDADILIIGSAAKVDHINNMRVIIASYLQSAYGYSEKDAKTIAHFITIYNAVYRGNLDSFKGKYKAVVLKYLTAEKVGLALRYDEWPGHTQIVIPLSDQKYSGTLSTIDTTSISDKHVVEKMREQDDKDIETRKDMIDLKERESSAARERANAAQQEADSARQDAEAKQGEATAAQSEAEKSKAAAEKSKQDAEKARKEAEAAQRRAQKEPNNPKAAKEAEKKQQEAEQHKQVAADKNKTAAEKASEAKNNDQEAAAKQKEAEAQKKAADEAAKKAENKEQEAAVEHQFADTKEQEAQSDRKDIAADTRKILEDKRAERKAQDDETFASALPGAVLKVVDSASMLSEVVLLDLKTEKPLRTSSLNTVRGRVLIEGTDSLIAIAGSKAGNQMITLVAMNPRTLEITKQGTVAIAEQSMLIKNDDSYYAVIEQSGKYFVARFNEDLKMQAKSAMNVIPYTALRITDKGLLVQDSANNIRVLHSETLAEALK